MVLIQNTALSCVLGGLGREERMTDESSRRCNTKTAGRDKSHCSTYAKRRKGDKSATEPEADFQTLCITHTDDLLAQKPKFNLDFIERWRRGEQRDKRETQLSITVQAVHSN